LLFEKNDLETLNNNEWTGLTGFTGLRNWRDKNPVNPVEFSFLLWVLGEISWKCVLELPADNEKSNGVTRKASNPVNPVNSASSVN
jgi:hypothetical protein